MDAESSCRCGSDGGGDGWRGAGWVGVANGGCAGGCEQTSVLHREGEADHCDELRQVPSGYEPQRRAEPADQGDDMKGGRDGVVIVPGDPANSLLVKLIRHEGPANDPMPMPSKAPKMSDADIATIEQWVKAGAVMPDDPPACP